MVHAAKNENNKNNTQPAIVLPCFANGLDKNGTPCEYYADKQYYKHVYSGLGMIILFVLIDLFYFAKSKEDKFEPYYQRLTNKEIE